ncbi:uncharacterized protein TM35_000511280 [Trypanosoma theileri]|uniref:Mucin-associated surface protein (MASP) n=1 Tax=Trypanosoma theileri TaxID=67003 RepID=A0A1X0NHA2_9TRYP|nr:uncharacterized protein TM35_000511280 [Trypanosoma theileri]ORC84027.1 hypothetical protein TM35_000511280 [Trypanosoma theileri]
MAVMVRCCLLCLLTLALCCASGLVWADSPKVSDALIKPTTGGVPPLVRRAIPSSGFPGKAEEAVNMKKAQKEELMENPEEQEDEVEENVDEPRVPGTGGSCPSGSDSNCPSGHSSGGNGGGHISAFDSLSENGVRGAGIAPGVQPQQLPLPPTLPHQQPAPGATCTPTSPDPACSPTREELTATNLRVSIPEKPGHGALVDAPSNKDSHLAADATGAQVTLGEAAPGIGSGSGTDDTSSSSNHSTASPPPAASVPAGDPQPGNSDNHASTAADNQGSAGTRPSSSTTSSSETVCSGSSEATIVGNGTSSAVSGSTSTQGGNVVNTDTTTTTTTTLPPELTNNKKGDADSSSSISSSVWVRVPLLIVVTLACILVC